MKLASRLFRLGAREPAPPAPMREAGSLLKIARLPPADVFAAARSRPEGLTPHEVSARRAVSGRNRTTQEESQSLVAELWTRAANPLNALLLILAAVSWTLGDRRAALVIAAIMALAIATAFVQEHRSSAAAARLRALVHTTASVRRRDGSADGFREVPIEELVPGDVVRISAGDMIPGDLRLAEAKDLFTNQSTLTGESMPVEKHADAVSATDGSPFEVANLCFMGANVVSGYATGVLLHTGRETYFGRLAAASAGRRPPTAFEQGIARFTWLMIRFMAIMVPAVFLINGFTKHDWLEALLFAVAVAVGLTPEMLPMIVTVNLARGALAMAREKVIVKRLDAIQDFGAMDVLCTDKTGTLTQDRIILKRHLDMAGADSDRVLHYAFLNSHFQSGLRNLLDEAVLAHADLHGRFGGGSDYRKIDEIPFDFARRRLSVVVEDGQGHRTLICKGAVEEIFSVSTSYVLGDEKGLLDPGHFETARHETRVLNEDGFRVVAVAIREVDAGQASYGVADERDLTLLGYIAFLDPPKESAAEAIRALAARGIAVKVLTGDNEVVTRKICREVGIDAGEILLGPEIAALGDADLSERVAGAHVFARLTPDQKERIIRLLRDKDHVVGFLGDGINDSAALKCADVGISVDTAVDIAKESADLILLEKNLLVLERGVTEGRRVFANVLKYIRMGASSNFGNMLSVVGASLFLPFLPMAPVQVLTNNLLYDLSQSAIPTDHVDDEQLAAPRRWDIAGLFRFMIALGPVSSLFDYATFAMMLLVFRAWAMPALFQTGWFVESLLSQTLIIHVIRTARLPFLESRASAPLLLTSLTIGLVGIVLPSTGIGDLLGFTPLPALYWPGLVLILMAYATLAEGVKRWLVRRWGI